MNCIYTQSTAQLKWNTRGGVKEKVFWKIKKRIFYDKEEYRIVNFISHNRTRAYYFILGSRVL